MTCGYGHIRRQLGQDNVSVQCMVMSRGTGCADAYCSGLGLWWESGGYVRVIPGGNRKQFYYEVAGQRPTYGRDIDTDTPLRWHPFHANGVKIQLTPKTIRLSEIERSRGRMLLETKPP